MARQLQYQRLLLLALLLGAAFAGLGYRLVDLQVLRHDELGARAQENTQLEFRREPRRGDILDARGNLLATSIAVKRVCADPTLIGDRDLGMARLLSPLLNLPPDSLLEKFKPRVIGQSTNGGPVLGKYTVLKNKVRLEDWETIQRALTNCAFGFDPAHLDKTNAALLRNLRTKAIFAENDQMRVYPNGALAAHVLGFVGSGADGVELAGKDGIELVLDAELNGARGWRVTEKDRKGREMVSLREQDEPPRDGLNAVLTIDAVIQNIVETALADAMEKHTPISISGIVVRPRTGEILALATLPNFDPNNLNASTPDARRNRVITDVMEPGSTFKTLVISAALNERLVTLNDTFFCENGAFSFAGHVLHDAEGHRFGNLAVQEIIMKSSNIGAAKIGIKLGEKKLYDYMLGFGLGARTGIPLPAEVNVKVHPFKDLSKVAIARVPMGQSVNVTRLQMAMAVSAIANKGVLMRPMLVDRLQNQDGKVVARYPPQRVRRVIGEEAAHEMVEALKTVVTRNGTAPAAALEHYTVAGKTGTAEKPAVGVGGYLAGKYVSSFVGFLPADDPEICIYIVLDEPDTRKGYYGGQIAAPIFKQIAERTANYLNVRPENGGEQPVTPGKIAAPADTRPIKQVAARSSTNQ
jgi:cell division protein FtsI/penicillin-binding protein 2